MTASQLKAALSNVPDNAEVFVTWWDDWYQIWPEEPLDAATLESSTFVLKVNNR